MSNSADNSFTQRAATAALPFTLIPIVFDIIKHFTQELPFLSIMVSVVKLGIVVAVLYTIMKKFTRDEGYVPYGRSFRFGMSLCTFSSIICTLWYVLNLYVIFPDQLDQLMEMMTLTFEKMSTSIDFDQVSRYLSPALIISSFISCIVWGLILSAILANFTKNDSPFAEGTEDQTEEHKEE